MYENTEVEYSIVIPVYNSEESINELFNQIMGIFENITSKFEVILVDDASKDNVWHVITKLYEQNKGIIRAFRLKKNFGQHNAILCGFNQVKGQYIITMDDDLQNPPHEIPKLIQRMTDTNADVVTGVRENKRESFFKGLSSKLFHFFVKKIFKLPKKMNFGSLNLLKREIVGEIIKDTTPNPLLFAMILKTTKKVEMIEVEHDNRKYGKTNYSIFKLYKFLFDFLTFYSVIPLNIITFMGTFISGIGFLGLIWILINGIIGKYSVGWPSLMIVIIFFGGLNLFSIGIIGEYLSRTLKEIGYHQQFSIDENLE